MNRLVFDEETLRFGRLLHYAGLAMALISGTVAYSWLYAPVEQEILNMGMRVDELTQSRQNADAILREHQRLSEYLQDIESRYAALRRRVPKTAEAGGFLRDVSEIARQEKLSINNFQPEQSVEGNGYWVMEVMLNGRGSFASICSFFDRLSTIRRLSKVKDVTISADDPLRSVPLRNLQAPGGAGAAGSSPAVDTYPLKATLIIYSGLQSGLDQSDQGGTNRG